MADDSFAGKRSGPRVALIAAAEMVERAGGTRWNVRVSELSARGCYVDTLNSFDVGSEIELHIFHNGLNCDVAGKIIYSHAGYGMGVLFENVRPEQQAVLDAWMAENTAAS